MVEEINKTKMKKAELGQYFLWEGQITQALSINEGHRAIGFKIKKKVTCPCCKEEYETDYWMDVIETSPMFQRGAEPIKTISGDPTGNLGPFLDLKL